jgi:hypothetical protein
MRRYLFLLFFAVVFSVNGHTIGSKSVESKQNPVTGLQTNTDYTYKIVPSITNTWCYDIYRNNKLLIHQQSIPGMHGNEGFKTKSDAKKVARLVIEKLKKGEMPPTVTVDEMKNLKVL